MKASSSDRENSGNQPKTRSAAVANTSSGFCELVCAILRERPALKRLFGPRLVTGSWEAFWMRRVLTPGSLSSSLAWNCAGSGRESHARVWLAVNFCLRQTFAISWVVTHHHCDQARKSRNQT